MDEVSRYFKKTNNHEENNHQEKTYQEKSYENNNQGKNSTKQMTDWTATDNNETTYKRFIKPVEESNISQKITDEKVWKPKTSRSRVETSEEGQKQYYVKTAQGFLNKITQQTFEKLSDKYVDIAKSKSDITKLLIDQIFEQALLQPTFCDLYAALCVKLNIVVPTFKKELLGKCQEEFQKDNTTNYITEEQKIKMKKRTLGNIKFISELYKNKILVSAVVHVCIKKLLQQDDDEEQLELLCKLLTGIGSMIDVPSSKTIMDEYF